MDDPGLIRSLGSRSVSSVPRLRRKSTHKIYADSSQNFILNLNFSLSLMNGLHPSRPYTGQNHGHRPPRVLRHGQECERPTLTSDDKVTLPKFTSSTREPRISTWTIRRTGVDAKYTNVGGSTTPVGGVVTWVVRSIERLRVATEV